MSRVRLRSWLYGATGLIWLVVSVGASPGELGAQIPDEFTNLKVLPQDIEQRQLMNAMRSFAVGLGVRCEYCHVGEPGAPLRTFDFASDEKEAKIKTRDMMRMVRAINSQHLTELDQRSEPTVDVQCATCHHGQSRPITLQRALIEAYGETGIEGAVRQYRTLRDRYYGTWTYDFSEQQLVGAAQQIVSRGSPDDGLALLELNLEFFPQSSTTVFTQGEFYLVQGDTTTALSKYRAALELDPNNRAAQRRISSIGGN